MGKISQNISGKKIRVVWQDSAAKRRKNQSNPNIKRKANGENKIKENLRRPSFSLTANIYRVKTQLYVNAISKALENGDNDVAKENAIKLSELVYKQTKKEE